ncbi:MAG: hypothetical protein QXO51_06750 [Halobacteria archaeon]
MAFEALPFSITLTLLLAALILAAQNVPRRAWRDPSHRRPWNGLLAGVAGFTIAALELATPGSRLELAENTLALVAGGLALMGGVRLLSALRSVEG